MYYDEIGSGKVTFDGSENWTIENYQGTVYFYISNAYLPNRIESFDSDNLKAIMNNNLSPHSRKGSSLPVYWTTTGAGYFEVYIEGIDTLEQLEQYLSQNPLTVVYKLAKPTRRPTSIIEAGDPDFSQGSTIYLHSDTEAIPTVHAKVAMDIAGQVSRLTKDSNDKSRKLHEHSQRIEANEIAIAESSAFKNLLLNSNFDGLDHWTATTGLISQPQPNVLQLYFNVNVTFGGAIQTLDADFTLEGDITLGSRNAHFEY